MGVVMRQKNVMPPSTVYTDPASLKWDICKMNLLCAKACTRFSMDNQQRMDIIWDLGELHSIIYPMIDKHEKNAELTQFIKHNL